MQKIKYKDYLKLAIWLSHHHSGQWSRGYRLLSKLTSKPYNCRWSSRAERVAEKTEIYQYLTEKYGKIV